MRLGQGSHTRNPWWCWAAMTVAAAATLSGAPLLVDAEEGNAPRRQAYIKTVILPAYNEDAESALREAMEQASGDLVRYAAAKSLAELGNEDVIVTLYYGLGNDRYFPRHLCNLGIKALTGRDLNDFGYNYSEGAHLSGVELVGAGHPIHDTEKKASRFRAIAEYCRWLRDEKPDIYARLDPDEDRIAPPTNPWSTQNGHDNQPGQQ